MVIEDDPTVPLPDEPDDLGPDDDLGDAGTAPDGSEPFDAPLPPTDDEDPGAGFAPAAIPSRALTRAPQAAAPSAVALRRADLSTLIDDFDARLIVAGVSDAVKATWAYSFRGTDGKPAQGISINGIPHAVREMAKRGEVIRLNRVVVVYEDEAEVRLEAMATRYAVTEGGALVALDTAVRAKRRKKTMMIGDWEGDGQSRRKVGEHEIPDPFWWEKAYSMAVRNATLPLLRQDVKSIIIAASLEAQATEKRQLTTPRQSRQPAPALPRGNARAPRPASVDRPDPGLAPQSTPLGDLLTMAKAKMGPGYGAYYRELLKRFPHAVTPDGRGFLPANLTGEESVILRTELGDRVRNG